MRKQQNGWRSLQMGKTFALVAKGRPALHPLLDSSPDRRSSPRAKEVIPQFLNSSIPPPTAEALAEVVIPPPSHLARRNPEALLEPGREILFIAEADHDGNLGDIALFVLEQDQGAVEPEVAEIIGEMVAGEGF